MLTRHEQAAAFMAEMYGRVTGRAAVVSATLGPGAINMQLGVADATTNSTPMVAISAQVGQDREYKESHQYVDLVSMFAPITRWADGIPTARAIPEMFRKAFKVAETERPAAVYLAVPEHIDADEADYDLTPLPRNVVRAEAPAPGQVERAVDILRNGQAAGGAGRARRRPRRRDRGAGPVLRRIRHPGGQHLPRQGRDARRPPQQHRARSGSCGTTTSTSGSTTPTSSSRSATSCRNSTPSGSTRRPTRRSSTSIVSRPRSTCTIRSDVGIIGDISASLDALTDALAGHRYETDGGARARLCLPRNSLAGQQDSRYPAGARSGSSPTPAPALGRSDVVLVDTGATKMWMARLYPTYERNTCLVSNGLSTMGFALPGALGVKLARPESQGAGRRGRRRVPDELAGNRDRRPRADTAGGADLGGRRLRPDRMEDGPRTRRRTTT